MTHEVTTVNGFAISPELSLFFSPSANFRLLRSLRSYREDVKCISNIFWVLVFERISRTVELKKLAFRICFLLPALSSPASRTPPDPYSPRLRPLLSPATTVIGLIYSGIRSAKGHDIYDLLLYFSLRSLARQRRQNLCQCTVKHRELSEVCGTVYFFSSY